MECDDEGAKNDYAGRTTATSVFDCGSGSNLQKSVHWKLSSSMLRKKRRCTSPNNIKLSRPQSYNSEKTVELENRTNVQRSGLNVNTVTPLQYCNYVMALMRVTEFLVNKVSPDFVSRISRFLRPPQSAHHSSAGSVPDWGLRFLTPSYARRHPRESVWGWVYTASLFAVFIYGVVAAYVAKCKNRWLCCTLVNSSKRTSSPLNELSVFNKRQTRIYSAVIF